MARLRGVTVVIDGATILADADLNLDRGQHLVVLGPNGSGKTTLLRVLSTYRYPTRGTAEVLGERFGRTDLRALRPRIGFVSTALDDLLGLRVPTGPLVAAACHGDTWPVRDRDTSPQALASAARALALIGAAHLLERRVDTLSQGERQRVRIARALAPQPELLLLDEPFAGLDLGGRETLLADLDGLLAAPDGPTVVLVTHHLEEIPTGITHGLLLRDGRVTAAGPVGEVLRSDRVGDAFGLDVEVAGDRGRWTARVRRRPGHT